MENQSDIAKKDSVLLSSSSQIFELAEKLKSHSIIAFDTEFIRESTFFPIVEIIQVATETESWIVDAQAFKKNFKAGDPKAYDPGIQPLLEVFKDKNILKVVHAAQGDQECLYTSFGTLATPTLDTAVAASLCGYGDSIGLGKLLKLVLNISLNKGHARTNWSARPLPRQLLEYARADVEHLVLLGKKLTEELDLVGRRSWALELSSKWENQTLFETNIEEMAQKLARGRRLDESGYAALLGLLKWREDRVRQLNLPRRWVADDNVLVDLAHVRPKDLGHLNTFRGINKGELKNSGETILEMIQKSSQYVEQVVLPKMPVRAAIPTAEETQVLDVLRCYVSILADQHKIAAKHLLTTSKLLPLLRNPIREPSDLVESGILSEEAARLIGAELIAMVQGKRALGVKKNQIAVISVKD
jgi:ribonuclease D